MLCFLVLGSILVFLSKFIFMLLFGVKTIRFMTHDQLPMGILLINQIFQMPLKIEKTYCLEDSEIRLFGMYMGLLNEFMLQYR